MAARIYLDHNATTPLLPSVARRLEEARLAGYANPASQHAEGRAARRVLEQARESITERLGGNTNSLDADQLVFTSGATEANTLALRGFAGPPGGTVVISSIEHPSVVDTATRMASEGFAVRRIRCLPSGVIDVAHAAELIEQDSVRVVSVMLANNETGVVQPVAAVARLCAKRGVPMHTDAVQAVGKQAVSLRELGVTALSFTAHKFHGPRGVGGLLVRGGARLDPLLHGGPQQGGLRAGTEVVDLALGTVSALDAWTAESEARGTRMAMLRDRLEQQRNESCPEAGVLGAAAPRLPHTSCIAFPGRDRQAMVMALDLAGMACSTGSACASGSAEPSPTLLAMNTPEELVSSAIRLSLGALTTADEVDRAADCISRVSNDLRRVENRVARA
mgnify:CR=1 FL=1